MDVKGECMSFHFRLRPDAAHEDGSGAGASFQQPGDAGSARRPHFLAGVTPAVRS